MNDTIYIVEDSETQARDIANLLEQQSYSIVLHRDAKSALEQLRASNNKPQLIISDVLMPDMDGFEFCKEVKTTKEFGRIPVMLLTNLHEPDEIVRGLECRCDAFITKPYQPRKLIIKINNLINSYRETDDPSKTSTRHPKSVHITFGGHPYYVDASHQQIIDLLLSVLEETYIESRHMRTASQEAQWMGTELKYLYAHYISMADAFHEGVIMTDRREVVRYVNPAAANLFGYSVEDLIGQSLDMGFVDGEMRRVTIPGSDGEDTRVIMSVSNFSWQGDDTYLIRFRPQTPAEAEAEAAERAAKDASDNPATD